MRGTIGLDGAKRYLTLKTGRIHSLPIAILMPHSSCNCRCVMCDIWKGNANQQQLSQADVESLLASFKVLGTRWVVMSGGEALMNRKLFELCQLLRENGIKKISILSTGLLLKRFARQVVDSLDEVIVSLDGSQPIHDAIRRVPRAYQRLCEGVQAINALDPGFAISGRCVIQRLNFADWPNIVDAARHIGLDQISFLAADVSSDAFNRPDLWDQERVEQVNLLPEQLPQMKRVLEALIRNYAADFENGFIAESADKLRRIQQYYAALHQRGPFPAVQCNAPWVSAVVEADGTVRPCYFHRPMGNIRQAALSELINHPEEIGFRQSLDMNNNELCRKCVCTLNLRPTARLL
ncbi:MAG: radical SAM protein [Chloroflexota bacterium]|nr:MAG: radical SAM protein [Chloroflexota bacterium]